MVKFRKISGLVLLSAFMLGVNSGHLVSAKKSAETVSKGTSVSKEGDNKTNSSENSGGNLDAGAVVAPKKEVMEPVAKLAEGSVSEDTNVTSNIPVNSSEGKTKATDVEQGDIGFAQGVGIASGTAGTIGVATAIVKKLFEKSGDSSKEGSKVIETNDNEDNGKNNSKTKDNQTDSGSSGSKTASMVLIYVAIAAILILFFTVFYIAKTGKCCIQGVCSCCC